MLRLVMKDIMIQKRYLIIGVIYSLLFCVFFGSMPETMYIMGGTAVAYIFILGAVGYDEKNKSEIVLNSLPIKRSDIVYSKYISSMLFVILATLLCGAGGALVKLLGIPLVKYYLGFKDFVAIFIAIAFLCTVYFPVYFKYGYHKSRYFNIIFFMAVFFIPNLITEYIKYNMTKEQAVNLINSFANQPEALMIAYMIGIVLIMFIISILISLRVYRKREF